MVKVKIGQDYPKDIEEMDKDEIEYSQSWWEDFCGSCDYFGKDECPHKDKVSDLNNWKTDIKCNKYWS